MKETELQRIEKINQRSAPIRFGGYKYVGTGTRRAGLRGVLGISREELYMKLGDNLKKGASGDGPCYHYYIKNETWNKLFPKMKTKSTPAPSTLMGRMDEADKWVDEQFIFDGKHLTGYEVSTYSNPTEFYADDWDEESADLIKKHYDLYGNITGISCYWGNGQYYFVLSDQLKDAKPYTPPRVHGYTAEYQDGFYKFGCAEISFETLRAAKSFLESTKATAKDNRKVESVKIGAGDFTLDILNQLILD